MKQYKVVFSDRAKKDLKKLDKHIQALLIGWIEKNSSKGTFYACSNYPFCKNIQKN